MSFALLSVASVLAGIVTLAIALWIAQRLRVQHREVEVISTIFWQQALEETRARVFVRRFRHWWAWALLATIAALIWILLAQPQTKSLDGTRHIILVDWGVQDSERRQADLAAATRMASSLPTTDREIIAVSTILETLLLPGEPVELANLRSEIGPMQAPRDLNWAIESLAARVTDSAPLAIYVVGDSPIDQSRLESVLTAANDQAEGDVLTVQRIATTTASSQPRLATLGVASSADGDWNQVDVWIAIAGVEEDYTVSDISVTSGEAAVTQSLTKRESGVFELRGLPADGSTLSVAFRGEDVGSVTLPGRTSIRVQLESSVPEALRQLIELDPACQIVGANAEILIGSSPAANFRLVGNSEPAFMIRSEQEDPDTALAGLVDRLALQQIDATGIAQASGRVVDVQVVAGEQRAIAVWSSLFTSAFDFQESRACPVFVSRSLRWLANRPPLVPYAALGDRLPVAAPEFARAVQTETDTIDGRTFRATPLAATTKDLSELSTARSVAMWASVGIGTWIGLLVTLLLVGEWVLYQRGQIP